MASIRSFTARTFKTSGVNQSINFIGTSNNIIYTHLARKGGTLYMSLRLREKLRASSLPNVFPSLSHAYTPNALHTREGIEKRCFGGACSMPWKEKAIKRRGLGEGEPGLSFFWALTFVFAFPTTKNLYRTGWRSSMLAEVFHSKRKLIGKRYLCRPPTRSFM